MTGAGSFNTVAADDPGDNIFLFTGAYTGGFTLLNNQRFLGAGATQTLAAITGLTLQPYSTALPATGGANPTVTSAGVTVTLGTGNRIQGMSLGNATTTDITGSVFGTLTVRDVTLDGTGRALDLTTGTLDAIFQSISSTTSATSGVILVSVGGSLSTTGGTTVTNAIGIGIQVSLAPAGAALNFGNTSITNPDGDTTGNTCVRLIDNTGNVTFGSLNLTPESGQRGLHATHGVAARPERSRRRAARSAATNAIAVEVNRTTAGTIPLAIVLTSVTVNGGTNGMVLNRTSGSFAVNGTGTTDGTGGTIQNTTNRGADFRNATNVALRNMIFTNAGTTDLDATNGGLSTGDNLDTNAAIHLESVTTATLDNISISGGAEQGINGNNVSTFTLNNSDVTNVGNAADEDNIHFFNMAGTSAITNTVLTHTSGGGDDNLNLQMQAGTLNLTISGGSALGAPGGVNQLGSGYLFGIRGTANAAITFSSATSTNNFSGGIVADAFDTSTMDLTVTGSTSSGNNDQLSVSAGDSSSVDLVATGNTLSSVATGDFVVVSLLGSAFDTGYTLDANISSNTITVANGLTADGVFVFNAGGAAMNISITNNTIDYAGTQRAIIVQAGQDGSGATNTTITGNAIDIELDGAGNAVTGILAQTAITGPGNTSSVCADIGGAGTLKNTFTHSLGGTMAGGDIRVRQRNDGTVRLPGYGGGATDTAAVITYMNGRNTVVSPTTATADSSGFAGGAACTQPTFKQAVHAKDADASSARRDDDLYVRRGDVAPEEGVPSLTEQDLSWMRYEAISRWRESGLPKSTL